MEEITINEKGLEAIPKTDPTIQIGPISIWVTDVTVAESKHTPYNYVLFGAHFLFKTPTISIFSPRKGVFVYELIKLKEGLSDMYKKISDKSADIQFCESEFDLKLSENSRGQIGIKITYRPWGAVSGSLEFDVHELRMDQSYLPKTIKQIEAVLDSIK